MYSTDLNLVYVQQQLAESFNLEELKMLCTHLETKFEDLEGTTLSAKTRELVIFCYRHGRLPELLEKSKSLNQSIDWSAAYQVTGKSDDLPEDWVEPIQQLYRMAKDFNRNRALPFSNERTRGGDEIAYQMREIAPFVFDQLDVSAWLRSTSIGKRLAAVKYLDWVQDVDHLDTLVSMLASERAFMQFHVLMTLDGLIDQLSSDQRKLLLNSVEAYRVDYPDSSRTFWRDRIIQRLHRAISVADVPYAAGTQSMPKANA